MIFQEPYFMKNEKWYYYDTEESKYKLTDEAPSEAIVSYEAFYESIKVMPREGETEEDFEKRIENLDKLICQDELSQKYDEEQQARKLYGV